MPIRFPTEAANDPGMKPAAPDGTPPDVGADGTPRGRADGTPDPKDKRGLALSAMAYQFLGGLVAHAKGLAAIAAPSVNSYKRLVSRGSRSGATWAPVHIAYGNNNRTGCVRVPGGRLEMRLPDSGCNPYLATAAIVAAGMDGVRRQLDPGRPNNVNLYEEDAASLASRGIGVLPQNLSEAIDAFEQDAEANYVYPLDNRGVRRSLTVPPYLEASLAEARTFYRGAGTAALSVVAPMIADRDYVLACAFTNKRKP